jgi:two-component system OmpR family sensor kinase
LTYQYQREKEYKIELLHSKLQDYNSRLYEEIHEDSAHSKEQYLDYYVKKYTLTDLRVTVIKPNGDVVYDSYEKDKSKLKNHIERKEIQRALKKGNDMTFAEHPKQQESHISIQLQLIPISLSERHCPIM